MEKLYVITPIFNPAGFKSRYTLYHAFAKYLSQFENVVHYTVELAPAGLFQITSPQNPHHIQVVGSQPLWYKENLINIGVSRLPSDAKYLSWIDADVIFTNPNWVNDAIELLQRAPVIQLWEEVIYLDAKNLMLNVNRSFASASMLEVSRKENYNIGVPGLAWACTRDWFNAVGGLLDVCIVGSADTYMANAIVGTLEPLEGEEDCWWSNKIEPGTTYGWACKLRGWQARTQIFNPVNKLECLTNNSVIHYHHGSREDRKYAQRAEILIDAGFDPYKELVKDEQGLYTLRNDLLCSNLLDYFKARKEDN